MSVKKFFAVFFILLVAVTAALPAMSASAYSYSCQGFYGKPYIFEIGWNISDKTAKSYGSAKVALSDKTSMTVWSLEDVLSNKKFGALINTYAEKAYADGRIDFFAVLAGEMDGDTLKAWYGKADSDKREIFKNICDYDDDDNNFGTWEDDYFDDKWDNYENYVNSSDYAKYGITYKYGHYYYNGELVRYFLDVHRRPSESRYASVKSNPNGKVSIEIERDKNGNITGVKKLTAKEIEKYFGDGED